MSYCTPEKTMTARKRHQCTYCADFINVGETYVRWALMGDRVFTNKLHPECVEALDHDAAGEPFFEYEPYGGERPAA